MTKPSKRENYHHGDLRAALLSTAGEMLEAEGPEAISFRAVARAVGVSATAPYNHFASKEELLSVIARAGFADLTASQAAAAASGGSPQERIFRLGVDYVGFALARPQLYRLMFGAGTSRLQAHPDVSAAKYGSFQPLYGVLAELQPADEKEAEAMAVGAWATVHGLSMLAIDGSLQPDAGGVTPGGLLHTILLRHAICAAPSTPATDARLTSL